VISENNMGVTSFSFISDEDFRRDGLNKALQGAGQRLTARVMA
jgi:hypothetical protein